MEEWKLINDIIVNAILDGCDHEGYFHTYKEDLVSAIKSWVEFKNMQTCYEVCDNSKIKLDHMMFLECPQIQKKE